MLELLERGGGAPARQHDAGLLAARRARWRADAGGRARAAASGAIRRARAAGRGGPDVPLGTVEPGLAQRRLAVGITPVAGRTVSIVLDPTPALGTTLDVLRVGPVTAPLPGWTVAGAAEVAGGSAAGGPRCRPAAARLARVPPRARRARPAGGRPRRRRPEGRRRRPTGGGPRDGRPGATWSCRCARAASPR